MFGKKKPERRTPRTGGNNLSQYGLFDVPTSVDYDNSDPEAEASDSDLEAELAALATGGDKPKRPARKAKPPPVNLDVMVAETLRDIPSDEEISGDDDDPELLSELNEITGAQEEEEVDEKPAVKTDAPINLSDLLADRLKMYELAEKNAKEAGETSRARRFGRGIKTLKDQIKLVSAGKTINQDDIPPVVTVNIQKRDEEKEVVSSNDIVIDDSISTPVVPEIPESKMEIEEDKPVIDVSLLKMLQERKNAFKVAALAAKKAGDINTAVNYIKIVKQFDAVVAAVEKGQPVDLSRMPEAPVQESVTVDENETQNESEDAPQLITASSLAEALDQRLEVYKKQEEVAKEQGNSSKSRRMGRIVKQYEQAIKANRAGKEVVLEDLPTPPGYAPLPGLKPVEEAAQIPATPKPSTPTIIEDTSPKIPAKPRSSGNHISTTRMEKQLSLLQQRQKEFKEAALNAKKKGEINQAKEFLRTAKGFEPLIEAAQGGLPVDITSLPVPPSAKSQLDTEYELVMAQECTEDDSGLLDILTRLESQLTKQLKLCLTTRDHHKALGDVAGMNRFEHLALSVTKDLDLVRIARKTNGAAVPVFHYEMRDFSVVKSFTDLNDNELELNIIRGINYNCANPKEIDTYVKFEFPYPQEDPVKDRTATVKDTNNPEYNANFKINILRTSRPCQRVFKRHAVKFEVYSKGCFASDWGCCFRGFFRGDTLMGTVTVKLQPLETQCELHESFDIMDGRKRVGGKLEVQLKLRDPLIGKEVQQLSERWLIIDR